MVGDDTFLISRAKKIIKNSPVRNQAIEIYKIYELIKRDRSLLYDKQTFKIMKKTLNKNSNCIDVGAYDGDILNKIIKIAPNGDHMAFEPIPMLYDELKKRYPGVKVYNYALSDNNNKTTFQHVTNLETYSGLKKEIMTRTM